MRIQAHGLSKTYGRKVAVDDLSFTVEPGVVTGFLGPNGAGKSTTMRLMLGLDAGGGQTTYDGKPLLAHPHPSQVVGAHLDAKFFHPTRTARNHLWMLAAEANIPKSRVDEVLALVGLTEVANKRPNGFSLGMGQRLGLAGALLAEPAVLMLDEPANGLDPQSIHWLRDFLRAYAAAGRSVFVSSHLLSEMELMADHLVVIAKGRMVANADLAQFISSSQSSDVLVQVLDQASLAAELTKRGAVVSEDESGGLAVSGLPAEVVGQAAFDLGLPVQQLVTRAASLERAFLELTSAEQEFQTGGQGGSREAAA